MLNLFFNNFVNYAGKIEAKRNIAISSNSITNKVFDYNTRDRDKAITKHYHKIRNEACGWKVLGQDELVSVNLNSLPSSIISGGETSVRGLKMV